MFTVDFLNQVANGLEKDSMSVMSYYSVFVVMVSLTSDAVYLVIHSKSII